MSEHTAKTIMVQGTASHVGKSVVATALCRVFAQDGLRVAPFKAMNMALNSFATLDGGEIGRSTATQAEAAGVTPVVEMNPVLVKPESPEGAQVVVLGVPRHTVTATGYPRLNRKLWPVVTRALDDLRARYDIVVIEGSGSPAEINLKADDIANMRVAKHAGSPVLLVGDIDRGGVFASLAGTMALLEPDERALVRAFVINKFRGDPLLLAPGLETLRDLTGVTTAGVLPYFTDIHIPDEDAVSLEAPPAARHGTVLDIAVVRLPHIANFDDFDPLAREPGVGLRYVAAPEELGEPDLVILPGTKATVRDLEWLQGAGLAAAIVALRRGGTPVIGICGGFQMLGERILDPDGVESTRTSVDGLGLLPAVTRFDPDKATSQVRGSVAASPAAARLGLLAGAEGAPVSGYEIHMGRTERSGGAPAFEITERANRPAEAVDGLSDGDGLTLGTYIHGLFHNDALRHALLGRLAELKGVDLPDHAPAADAGREYDRLAALAREYLDMDLIYRAVGLSA
jgi:adenosylcobyric acid synthase